MIRVLAVDDEEPFRRLLNKELTRKGFSVEVAAEGKAALAKLETGGFDVLLLDILMPGMDGLALMQTLQKHPSAPPIVVLTGKATVETAVEAMKNGAYDYLTKPYKLDELEIVIRRAHEYGALRLKSELLQKELIRKESPVEMVGSSRPMRTLLALIRKIAPSDSNVLILGESGTGKELVANTLWHFSRRSEQPIIALNCATFSEPLMESELFGHEKGAFTTAYETKHGIVEVADGGTLFLDEIAEMPLALQAKLLRFLDTGEFRRVGSNRTRRVDVRLIAATNKDLKAHVVRKNFREDLFYRLNVIRIEVPPLRERREDIPELSRHFIQKYARKMAKSPPGIDEAALSGLAAYDWPGNVRELENEMERALLLCDSEEIGPQDLSLSGVTDTVTPGDPLRLDELEKACIVKVLRETGGNQSQASRILGINRKTLYLKIKKYGISGPSD